MSAAKFFKDVECVVFREKECGNYFTCYKADPETIPGWAVEAGLEYYFYVCDGSKRWVRIAKTVAYVAVDEDAWGVPVFEKWAIKPVCY